MKSSTYLLLAMLGVCVAYTIFCFLPQNLWLIFPFFGILGGVVAFCGMALERADKNGKIGKFFNDEED